MLPTGTFRKWIPREKRKAYNKCHLETWQSLKIVLRKWNKVNLIWASFEAIWSLHKYAILFIFCIIVTFRISSTILRDKLSYVIGSPYCKTSNAIKEIVIIYLGWHVIPYYWCCSNKCQLISSNVSSPTFINAIISISATKYRRWLGWGQM